MVINELRAYIVLNHKREPNLHCLVWRKKNRSHFEIIASMLEAMRDNSRALYPIMKHAGSNYTELKKYLNSLTEIGFIEKDIKQGRVLYRASEKGLNFLRQYYVLLGMLFNARACVDVASPKCVHVY